MHYDAAVGSEFGCAIVSRKVRLRVVVVPSGGDDVGGDVGFIVRGDGPLAGFSAEIAFGDGCVRLDVLSKVELVDSFIEVSLNFRTFDDVLRFTPGIKAGRIMVVVDDGGGGDGGLEGIS